jgi:hypothetical protein
MTQAVEFLIAIAPSLLEFGGELFHLFQGNIDLAKAEIRDRRADIAARRARNDAAIDAKYPPKG